MKVKIKKIDNKCIVPRYMTNGAAGFDLYACIDKPIFLRPLERALVPVGFCIELESGLEAQIRPRSGLAWKEGITVLNSPGTIDEDYRGEIKVMLVNLGDDEFVIENGMRIAQMIISKYEKVNIEEVKDLSDTNRNSGGFGSTGM